MERTPLERLDTVNAYIVCSEVFDGHYLFDLEQELPTLWRIHRQRAELVRFDVRCLDSLVCGGMN